jgi:hypothetical protein
MKRINDIIYYKTFERNRPFINVYWHIIDPTQEKIRDCREQIRNIVNSRVLLW